MSVSNSVAGQGNVGDLGMTPVRVTDLEKFTLDYIWRPYWLEHPAGDGQFGSTPKHLPFTLDQTAVELAKPSDWRNHVVIRLARLGVTFPDWIQHPLVTVIKDLLADPRTAALVERDKVKA